MALLLAGCGPSAGSAAGDGRAVVLVQAPAGELPSPATPESFRDPYPPGSRVVVWSPREPRGSTRVLSRGFFAAGAPSVSPEGTRVLFCGKRREEERWGIFEVDLRGGTVRRITPESFHALHPAWAAGDRIVFSADREGTADPRDGGRAFSLHTCRIDGSELERITFNPGSDIEPTVLKDGRVLYSAWQPPGPDRPRGGWALFTVRIDGTGLFPFYGSHHPPVGNRCPRELEGRKVAFLAPSTDDPEAPLALRTVAFRRPLHSLEELCAPGRGSWRSAASWSGDSLLVTFRARAGSPGGRATFGLYVMVPGGEPRLLYDDETRDEIEAVPSAPTPRPRGLVSDTRPGKATGTLLCLDARRTDRHGLPETRLPAVRVRIYRGRTDLGEGWNDAGRSDRYPREVPRELVADIPLASDGSFLAEVPADVPLRFETVDTSGRPLLDSLGWVWVRPGEQRSCIGCHEDRETSPPNHAPLAVRGEGPPPDPGAIALRGATQ